MFFQGELTPNGYSFFPVRYVVVLPEALLERVSVLTVEQGHPLGLLPQVFEDRIVSLRQHPDGLLGVAAGEGQLREGVFLFRHRLRGAAVVDDEKGRLAFETVVPKAEPIVQAFARVDNIYLRVPPYPRAALVSGVVPDGGAQYDDVVEDPAIGPFEEV